VKLNKKGFMMAEVVVVSAIVLIVLTALYVSYNKLYSVYNTRLSYYDTVSLYRLGYYRDILIENDIINTILVETKNDSSKSKLVYNKAEGMFSLPDNEKSNYEEDTVFLIYTGGSNISSTALDKHPDDVSITFKEYIDFLSTSATIKSDYVMVMERCNNSSRTPNKDDCKYAYLEVYDGYEET